MVCDRLDNRMRQAIRRSSACKEQWGEVDGLPAEASEQSERLANAGLSAEASERSERLGWRARQDSNLRPPA